MKADNKRKRIIPAMFDIRPVTGTGELDIQKVKKIKRVINLKEIVPLEKIYFHYEKSCVPPKGSISSYRKLYSRKRKYTPKHKRPSKKTYSPYYLSLIDDLYLASLKSKTKEKEKIDLSLGGVYKISDNISESVELTDFSSPSASESVSGLPTRDELLKELEKIDKEEYEKDKIIEPRRKNIHFGKSKKELINFILAGIFVAFSVFAFNWVTCISAVKKNVINESLSGYSSLISAKESLKQTNFDIASYNFSSAWKNFADANSQLKKLGVIAVKIIEYLPDEFLVSSGKHLLDAGEHISKAGRNLSIVADVFSKNYFSDFLNLQDRTPLTDIISACLGNLRISLDELHKAEESIGNVNQKSLPYEYRENVRALKDNLPRIEKIVSRSLEFSEAILDILGHYQQKQYLLIFQNNSELRATGGFIGTYGVLTLDKGRIRDLFIDGIYNADGQLKVKVVPPFPIQKISTAWSMHDANWFFDFPVSAKKIAWFYEKTGGPTVDGVIAINPVLIEKLLSLTGPISMEKYKVSLNTDNFREIVQYKVEEDYDKILNRPKQILKDFAPLFLSKLTKLDSDLQKEAIKIIFDCLEQKDILIYFRDDNLEEFIKKQGWAGEIISTDKDYLAVVNSNICGYKTDRVIEQEINHFSEIQSDGSIINTVVIKRKHKGGDSSWYNKVNSDFMRIYVPLGSQLLSVEGNTREENSPPIDYSRNGFITDELVDRIEKNMKFDQKNSTYIFEESGKTVFGSWVYVSPGHSVEVVYKYKLPFKININKPDSYNLIVQKQSGINSKFSFKLDFPSSWKIAWKYPENWNNKWIGELTTDKIFGVAFE